MPHLHGPARRATQHAVMLIALILATLAYGPPFAAARSPEPAPVQPAPLAACLPGYHSAWWSQSDFPELNAGQTATVTITFQNTGCNTWGTALRLGTWNPIPGQDVDSNLCDLTTGSGWEGCHRIVPDSFNIGYLGYARFTFRVKAPAGRGSYRVYVRPLIEAVQWMEDEGVYMEVATRLYRRSVAVAYADQYSTNSTPGYRNTAYPDFLDNDCANFVSQMLFENAFPTASPNIEGCQAYSWWRPYTGTFFEWHYPQSWSLVECQRAYFSYTNQYFYLKVGATNAEMSPGDVWHMDLDGDGLADHARIYIGPGTDILTGVYSSMLISQHTTERKRRDYSVNWDPSLPNWKWHVTW